MTSLVLIVALLQQDPTYAALSRAQGLGPADRLVRDGKYLEAAVAYRNVLLSPGDREAVRIPLALSLLAKGDAGYAGIELRRAHMLYPDFSRLVLDPAELFGSKGVLAKAADAAVAREKESDVAEVNAVAAFAYLLEGQVDRGRTALAKYVQSRGNDAFAAQLGAALAKPVAANVPPPPAPAPVQRGGDPVRAGPRFIEPQSRPRAEILSR